MEWSLTFVAIALIAVAAFSRRLSGSLLTPAMLFVAIPLQAQGVTLQEG